MSRPVRLLLLALVVLVAAWGGFRAAVLLSPERLHERVEAWLEEATHAEAKITSLRFVFGFPAQLEGRGLRLYDGALTVERASARLDVVRLLLGRPRLTRLRLDGAHLRLQRSPEGAWSPPIFPSHERDFEEPALAPLRAIEGTTRLLLTKPLLADTLVIRRSRVSLLHADPGGSDRPVRVAFENVSGRLLHSRLFGDARLFLRVQLVQDGASRGRLEWNGMRDDRGAMQVTMAATGLDLASLATYARGARPGASLGGMLDGVADFRTEEPGVGRLDLDVAARDFETSLEAIESELAPEPEIGPAPGPEMAAEGGPEPGESATTAGVIALPSVSLRMRVDLDHDHVVLSNARIRTGDLSFALDARIARPLAIRSTGSVTLSLEDLAIDPKTSRAMAGWLPAVARERFSSLAGRVRSGRLVRAALSGSASVRVWREAFSGHLDHLPAGLRLALEVEDTAIDVDERNRLEDLDVRLAFENDHLQVFEATGNLNGGPLPALEVSFRGVSKLLSTPPGDREMASSTEALVGFTPLFEFFDAGSRDAPPDEEPSEPPKVAITFERLHHPALLWPLHDVRVELSLREAADGLRMEVEHCAWAGVLLDGVVDWTLRGDRRVAVELEALRPAEPGGPEPGAQDPAAPGPGEPAPDALAGDGHGQGKAWVIGRFEVGEMDSPRWSQRRGTGRFSAVGGRLLLEDVEVSLQPRGRIAGEAELDLTHADRVPYSAVIALEEADLGTLVVQRGAPGEVVTGALEASAKLAGSLVPGQTLLHDASGSARLRAADGAIQRSVPPVLALALASSSLNPFSRRDELRYTRAEGEFEIEAGLLRTSGLEIEGPDVRLFASGGLDLGESPFQVDAEVVLFLFRQFDRALELIPILNVLLLGENDNLVAAYFQLVGPWDEPVATAKPLRTLEEGPGDVLTKGIPRVVKRGIDAIGGLFRSEPQEAAPVDPGNGDPASAEDAGS